MYLQEVRAKQLIFGWHLTSLTIRSVAGSVSQRYGSEEIRTRPSHSVIRMSSFLYFSLLVLTPGSDQETE
jgi:hypothetical protein